MLAEAQQLTPEALDTAVADRGVVLASPPCLGTAQAAMKAVLPAAEATRTQNRTTRCCLAVIAFLYSTAVMNVVRLYSASCRLLLPVAAADAGLPPNCPATGMPGRCPAAHRC